MTDEKHVSSSSDERTANNTMRHKYRVLSDEEKVAMDRLKDLGDIFTKEVDKAVTKKSPREAALARTKIEEAVMWAVKGLTAGLLALGMAPSAAEAGCALELSVGALHAGFDPEDDLNGFGLNPGGGFSCAVAPQWRVGAMLAQNSFGDPSPYVLVTYDAWRWDVGKSSIYTGFGFGGTWYKDLPELTDKWDHEVAPIGGMHLSYDWHDTGTRANFRASYVPGGGLVGVLTFTIPLAGG